MNTWEQLTTLNVNERLKEIMGKWFKVDLIYTDQHGNILGALGESTENYDFKSMFFKLFYTKEGAREVLNQDIQKGLELVSSSDDLSFYFETHFKKVRALATKIIIDYEFAGAIFAFPYVTDSVTQSELDHIQQEIENLGISHDDAKQAIASLNRMQVHEFEYLKELMSVLSHEISDVFQEVEKREERISSLNNELSQKYKYHNLIGQSDKIKKVFSLLEKISSTETTILVQGENGTGKELVAKAIHYNSPRKDAPFTAVNCSAFNDNLLDSELFGHVKGSFTGAHKDKKGLFEVSNGGTLFLDEVGDMSLAMQVKLLRVLQEGTFLPVGANMPKKVNVRVIAATNRPLKEMIEKGEFREDLYYRINVINVQLPSLKERLEDIPLLMDAFLDKKCSDQGLPVKSWSKKVYEKFMDYHWPGNVRELQNEVERLVVLSGDERLITEDFLSEKMIIEKESKSGSKLSPSSSLVKSGNLKIATQELEIFMIREGLKRHNNNKSKLAKELGISRASLIMKVDKYELGKKYKDESEAS